MPVNVITTEEQTLIILFRGNINEEPQYIVAEFVQVNLDGVWYTLSQHLSLIEEPLIVENVDRKEYRAGPSIEHMVDLSVIGKLPPGKYRLVEKFLWEQLKEENYAFAYFWVIEPGGKIPPESETKGRPRMSDIIVTVESINEARRCITDRDDMISIVIENISGKNYFPKDLILEMKKYGIWQKIDYPHANLGLISPWQVNTNEIFLNEHLKAGKYRIRLSMNVNMLSQDIREPDDIEIKCEFTVLSDKDAPKPEWKPERLQLSPYDAAKQSTGIIMTLTNPVFNQSNTELEIILTAENSYFYGSTFQIEVLIDEKWYYVPFVNATGFSAVGCGVEPNSQNPTHKILCNPVRFCGILPVGHYRMIKEFSLLGLDTPEGHRIYLANEFAIVEFSVEETLFREPQFYYQFK